MTSLNISSPVYKMMNFHSQVPEEFVSSVLRDSRVSYCEGTFGKILLQEVDANGITILYNAFQIDEDIPITFSWKPGNIQVQAALETRNHYTIEGLGDVYLEQGEFNLLGGPSITGIHFLKAGRKYQNIHILYSREFLNQLFPLFPTLADWSTSVSLNLKLLFQPNLFLTNEQRNVIKNILNYTQFRDFPAWYLEIMAKQFLLLSVVPIDQRINTANGLSRQYMQLINESRRLVDTSLSRFLTATAVANELGISEIRLRDGFKKVFGVSLSEYIIQTKMELGQKLLSETNKPIKEIACLTGYSTKQSFFNAFRKYFHQTPGSIRLQMPQHN